MKLILDCIIFVSGFIIGQLVLICIALASANKNNNKEPSKEDWKQEGMFKS